MKYLSLLLILLYGCSIGPVVSVASNFGYKSPSVGVLARGEFLKEDSFLGEGEVTASNATKAGSKKGGAVVVRGMVGKRNGSTLLLAGVRRAYQQADTWDITTLQPSVGLGYAPDGPFSYRLYFDFPDDSHHETSALALRVDGAIKESMVATAKCEYAHFDKDRGGFGCSAGLLYRIGRH